jgi:hypothetical protein
VPFVFSQLDRRRISLAILCCSSRGSTFLVAVSLRLTAYSTKLNYNYGIAERDEVQYVDIRCPYNGQMIYPSASLLYTDAQFGDTYETVKFDFSTGNGDAAAHILAALKGLPNEVLSDNWNPVSGTLQKVKSVQVQQLETNNHYRIIVTFNDLLGDVPTLSGKAYFKCKGGAVSVTVGLRFLAQHALRCALALLVYLS